MGLFDIFKRQSPQISDAAANDRENESWIVLRGDQVIQKKARTGVTSLTDWEKLAYCLWVADYMMRNAGDFANAVDMYPQFQSDAALIAKSLGLTVTHEAFSLTRRKLQREYFSRFDSICSEVKNLDPQKQ